MAARIAGDDAAMDSDRHRISSRIARWWPQGFALLATIHAHVKTHTFTDVTARVSDLTRCSHAVNEPALASP